MLPKHRSRKKRELKFRLETPIFKNETIMHELLFDEKKFKKISPKKGKLLREEWKDNWEKNWQWSKKKQQTSVPNLEFFSSNKQKGKNSTSYMYYVCAHLVPFAGALWAHFSRKARLKFFICPWAIHIIWQQCKCTTYHQPSSLGTFWPWHRMCMSHQLRPTWSPIRIRPWVYQHCQKRHASHFCSRYHPCQHP